MSEQERTNQELTDEQLDSAINNVLESPEVNAMLDNVAADAAEDFKSSQGKFDAGATITPSLFQGIRGGLRPDYLTWREFKAFEDRVAAAFKHAGFKF